MGFLDFLTSTKRPKSGTPIKSREEVVERLKGLNRPTAPYQLIDGQSEGVDLIAEWKIVDAFTEELRPGEAYNYRFSTKELKTPIQQAVTDSGWTYEGVAFGKL